MFGLRPTSSHSPMFTLDHKIGANSEVFNNFDPLTVDTDGFLIVATAGTRVVGVANVAGPLTMSASNETVAKVYVPFRQGTYLDLFEAEMSAAITATNVGQYADLTGTTGAVLIDQGSVNDNTGQFYIRELDPWRTGSPVAVLVSIAEPEELAYTQN